MADRDSISATRSALDAIDPAFSLAVDPLFLGYSLCVAVANNQAPAELRDIVRGEIKRLAPPSAATARPYAVTDATADRVVGVYEERYCGGIDPDQLR